MYTYRYMYRIATVSRYSVNRAFRTLGAVSEPQVLSQVLAVRGRREPQVLNFESENRRLSFLTQQVLNARV